MVNRQVERKELVKWKVMLQNDHKNKATHVAKMLEKIVHLKPENAALITKTAHDTGSCLIVLTHWERAELYREQFADANISVKLEKA